MYLLIIAFIFIYFVTSLVKNLMYIYEFINKYNKEKEEDNYTKYKKLQELTLDGDFYRSVTPFDGNVYAYSIVSKDKKRAVFSANVIRNGRNFPHMYLKIYGLADDMLYEIDGKTLSGKTLRTHGILLLFTERSGQTFFYEIKAV